MSVRALGGIELRVHHVVDYADLGCTVADEGDGNGEMRDATGKVCCAVDGVHHPDVALEGAAAFFAKERVVRKELAQPAANQLFHLCIGRRQEILRPLEVRP
jgi:hypothetical protein